MDYRQAAKVLTDELKTKGYQCRLDANHGHPRLYIGCAGMEKFAVLSSSSNYDEGNLMKIKRRDIERDIIPQLPLPVPGEIQKNDKLRREDGIQLPKQNEVKVYPVGLYMHGRGGSLVISIPRDLTNLKTKMSIFLTKSGDQSGISDNRLGMILGNRNY